MPEMLCMGKGRISSPEAMRAFDWLAELLGGGARLMMLVRAGRVVVEWLSGLVVVSVRPFFGFGEVQVHLSKEWPIFPHV